MISATDIGIHIRTMVSNTLKHHQHFYPTSQFWYQFLYPVFLHLSNYRYINPYPSLFLAPPNNFHHTSTDARPSTSHHKTPFTPPKPTQSKQNEANSSPLCTPQRFPHYHIRCTCQPCLCCAHHIFALTTTIATAYQCSTGWPTCMVATDACCHRGRI
jgi:hypothetical protein